MIQNESSLTCGRCGAKGEYEHSNSFEVYPEGWTHLSGVDICPDCSAVVKGQIDFFMKSRYRMIDMLSEN